MDGKMRVFIFIFVLGFCLFSTFQCKVNPDKTENETKLLPWQQRLVMEMNPWLIPTGPRPLVLTDAELGFLDQLQEARIVALGEATHGTKEFFQAKHRIFRYLAEHFGHKIFAFEADFAESLYFDNYVGKGEGDLTELMKSKMVYGVWQTEEVRELLEWMREYNKGKKENEKIHYFGFDCKINIYQLGFLQEYLQAVQPGIWDTLSPPMIRVRNLKQADYDNMPEDTYEDMEQELAALPERFAAHKEQLLLHSSLLEYETHKHLLTTFWQAFVWRYHYSRGLNSTAWRDRFMAENALWLADRFGPDTKISLWAHNDHIARNPDYALGESGSMGYCLYETLADRYQAVGFGFSLGSFTAELFDEEDNSLGVGVHTINTEPKPFSYNRLFHYARYDNFAFHLDSIPAASYWNEYIGQGAQFLSIGAEYNGNPNYYYSYINLSEHFNWLLYFDKTNAAEKLD